MTGSADGASIDYTPFDRQIWEAELEGFVPARLFDLHTHLWSERHAGGNRETGSPLRREVDLAGLRAWSARLYPGRETGFLVLGTPLRGMDRDGHNRWLAAQVRGQPRSRAGMIVTPEMAPGAIEEAVRELGFVALKPYRCFAPDPAHARIAEFFPEPQMEAADGLGLAVTLHLSMPDGPASEENLRDLAGYTHRYPRIRWILAHCARGFNAAALERSIHRLADLPTAWLDTSAVNDLYSHYLALRYFDRRRILFGSDNVAAGCMRGMYISYARAWQAYPGAAELEHCDPRPTFVVYEQLRAMKRAAGILSLGTSEIDGFFSGNALELIARIESRR
jgi:predicted TIM-barrel fold metal-dependent hydrolase